MKKIFIGQQFGLLTVVRRLPDFVWYGSERNPSEYPRLVVERYYCNCECGTKDILVNPQDLLYAGVTSCGCWKDPTYGVNLAYVLRVRRQARKNRAEFIRKYPLLKKFFGK